MDLRAFLASAAAASIAFGVYACSDTTTPQSQLPYVVPGEGGAEGLADTAPPTSAEAGDAGSLPDGSDASSPVDAGDAGPKVDGGTPEMDGGDAGQIDGGDAGQEDTGSPDAEKDAPADVAAG